MRLDLFSRQLWLPGVARGKIRYKGGVREWIRSGEWSLNANLTKKRAQISLYTVDDFVDATLSDAIRQSIAAFESARAVECYFAEPKSYAWQFISYYYAGYFAANALMRLCGYGCTNLYQIECAEINQQALLYGVGGTNESNKITPGVYFTSISLQGTPYWSLSQVGGKGGVHIQFWIAFLHFLDDLDKYIKTSSLPKSDRDAARGELSNLISGLKHSSTQNGSWLSEVRNAMNYRLEYGTWFPYEGSVTDGIAIRDTLSAMLAGNMQLPKRGQSIPDPTRAVRLSGYLLSWLKTSLVTLEASSSGKTKELISNGALKIAKKL